MSISNPSSIANYAQRCISDFQIVQNSYTISGLPLNLVHPSTAYSLDNGLARFRLWCGNIGAHQRDRSSLDQKLREASHIRDRVVELLQRIQNTLAEIKGIVNGERIPWDAESESDSDGTDQEPEAATSDSSTTELDQHATVIADVITDLMQLSSTIGNPAPHDQFKLSQGINIEHYEKFDVEHVELKFPLADRYLTKRLGRAISRRRQYLRYREEHRIKLEKGLDPAEDIANEADGTVASSIPSQLKSGPFILNANYDNYENHLDDAASQTSYASSAAGTTTLRPPPLPWDGHDGMPFECPFCRYFVLIDEELAWQRHVFRDLQPYVTLGSWNVNLS